MHFTLLRINFLLFAFLGGTQLFAQTPINRLFGTYQTETGTTGLVLQDSTIYAVGTSSAFVEYSSQIYLIKVDKNGDLLWSKFYGGTGVDEAVDMYVDLTTDTSIYIVSTSFINFSKGYDVKMTKVDKNGNFIWEKNYGTSDWDIASKMIKTSTGMFAVCGKTYGNTMGSTDGMVLLLDANGDSLAFTNYGDAQENMFHDLIERSADTLVFCGETYTVAGKQRAWLFELNIETGLYNSSYFGSVFNRTFNSIENYKNGNYLLSITSDSSGVTQTDVAIEVLEKNTHVKLLQIPFIEANDERAVEVKFFNDELYFLALTKTYGWGEWEAAVYVFDTLGAYQYSNTFGAANNDYGSSIIKNNNKSFAFIGSSGADFGISDLWVVNLDSLFTNIPFLDSQLDINSIHESQNNEVDLNVYPNPFNSFIKVDGINIPEKMTIYDAYGRFISFVANSTIMNLEDLSKGTYILSVEFKNGLVARKCLIKSQ
jgi:hypothetical protein